MSRLERHGVRGRAFASDQADPEQAAHLVDEVMAAFGRLDILVDDAGIIAFLAGPEAGFVTGATLNVDGGFMA